MISTAVLVRRRRRGTATAQIITATLTPAMSPLFDGDAMEDVTNWSSFDQTSNYASTEGTIVSAVVAYTGDAVDASTALDAGDTVGFTVTVTDSEANERVFNAGSTTVAALAPAQFGTGDWSVANAASGGTVDVSVSAVPDDGGAAITDIEYQVDGGAWVSSGTTDTTGFEITGLTDDVEVDIALRAVNAAGNGTASATKAVTPTEAVTPAVITINSIGPQDGDGGEVPVDYTIDKDDATVEAVVYAASEAPPGAADFGGGGDPAYIDLGPVALDTSGTPIELALPDDLDGSYRLALLPTGGGDGDVAVSAAVSINTVADAMANDTGVIYWYGYDDTTRSGTDVTAVNDKGGNAFALDTTPVAFAAPTQADASSPVVFDGTNPDVIQTATKVAGNRLLQQHFIGGGSARVFIVLDGASVDAFFGAVLNESNDHQANLSILFGAGKFGSNLRFYALGRQFANAFSINYDSGVPLAGLGTVIVEYLITQTDWTTYLNGTENSTGTVTAANFPTHGTARTSLGARASDTSSADAATCAWREIFTTSTVDETHAANIRAQLAAKYSITLPE